MIAAADSALYQAKASGRNRTCIIAGPVGETAAVMPNDRRRSAIGLVDPSDGGTHGRRFD